MSRSSSITGCLSILDAITGTLHNPESAREGRSRLQSLWMSVWHYAHLLIISIMAVREYGPSVHQKDDVLTIRKCTFASTKAGCVISTHKSYGASIASVHGSFTDHHQRRVKKSHFHMVLITTTTYSSNVMIQPIFLQRRSGETDI